MIYFLSILLTRRRHNSKSYKTIAMLSYTVVLNKSVNLFEEHNEKRLLSSYNDSQATPISLNNNKSVRVLMLSQNLYNHVMSMLPELFITSKEVFSS